MQYIYIDDPISSLDDNNAIAVACDLAKLLRRTANLVDENDEPAPIKVVLSTHHALFFNVMCNELGRSQRGEGKVKLGCYSLQRPNNGNVYSLCDTSDTPFFHHVANLVELKRADRKDKLYTYHFNALRSIMEKTASFFGEKESSFWMKDLYEEAYYNRATQLFSHGKYAIHDPAEMGEDNKALFRRIFNDFLERFKFNLPDIFGETTTEPTP